MAPRAMLFVMLKGVAVFVNVCHSAGFNLFINGGWE